MNGSLIGLERHEDEELMTEFSASKRATDSVLIHSISSACDRLPHRVQVTAVSETFDLRAEQKKKNVLLAQINIPTSTFDSVLKCVGEGVINS